MSRNGLSVHGWEGDLHRILFSTLGAESLFACLQQPHRFYNIEHMLANSQSGFMQIQGSAYGSRDLEALRTGAHTSNSQQRRSESAQSQPPKTRCAMRHAGSAKTKRSVAPLAS
jgi:hypothetical protein